MLLNAFTLYKQDLHGNLFSVFHVIDYVKTVTNELYLGASEYRMGKIIFKV